MSIKIKLIVVLSSVLVLAFVGTNLASYIVSRGNMRTQVLNETLPLISNNIYSEVQRDLMHPIDVSSLMANDTFLKDWALNGEKDVNKITKYLKEIKQNYGFFTAFFISEKTGLYYHYQGIHKKISPSDAHDVWYYNFKDANKKYDLDVDTDEVSHGTLTIFINHRLNDHEGNFLGVTGVGLKMDHASRIMQAYQEKYKRTVYLVDEAGIIQIHPDKSLAEKRNLDDPAWFGERAREVLAHKSDLSSFEFERGGQNILLAVRFFEEFDWFLIVEQDEYSVLKDIRAALISNLALGLLVTGFIIVVVVFTVNHYQGRLETLATTDGLTGVANRRHFLEMLDRELARSARFGQSVSLLMIDADHFKAINDSHGHDTGDMVLRLLSETLIGSIRKVDFLGRLGGEEFAVFLPQTRQDDAVEVAERVRAAVQEQYLDTDKGPVGLTVTIGVATAKPGGVERKELMRAADQAMLGAKEAGRNQVGVAG